MSKKTVHPHNAFFMVLMDNPEAFAAYMVLHIPPEEYSQYDWAKVQSINTDFIGDNLSEQRADLLFSVPYQQSSSSVLVHLHLEHQSSIDKEMDVRILRYQLAIISKYIQNHTDRPLIRSIVMYNGEKDWSGDFSYSQKLPDNRPVSGGWLDFSYVVQSVPTLSLDVIRQVNNARAQLLLIVFQAGKRFFEQGDSQRLLGQNLGVNRGLIPFTFTYFRYIFEQMDDLREQFMSVLEYENVDIMSKKFFYEVWFSDAEKAEIEEPLIAQGIERGFERGIEQGIERGREEGQRQTLMTAVHNMLQQGFDVETIAKCLSISEAEVLQIQAEHS